MNFEKYQQLLDEQVERLAPITEKIKQLEGFKQEAKEELEKVDPVSRKAFSIKGEIVQLEKAIPEASIERINIVEDNARQLKERIKNIRLELTSDMEQELSNKYKEDVIAAGELLISLLRGYKADEEKFTAKITEDILQFKGYDNGKYPSIAQEAYEFTSYGYHEVFYEELQRILKFF